MKALTSYSLVRFGHFIRLTDLVFRYLLHNLAFRITSKSYPPP